MKILTIAHSRLAGTRWISRNTPEPPHRSIVSLRGRKTPTQKETDISKYDLIQSFNLVSLAPYITEISLQSRSAHI